MAYLNVGAWIGDDRARTKKELKQTLATRPELVRFDVTQAFGPMAGKVIAGDQLPQGTVLAVVGPDPYTKRRWYAAIKVGHLGQVVFE